MTSTEQIAHGLAKAWPDRGWTASTATCVVSNRASTTFHISVYPGYGERETFTSQTSFEDCLAQLTLAQKEGGA